jgi:hypothetical protein
MLRRAGPRARARFAPCGRATWLLQGLKPRSPRPRPRRSVCAAKTPKLHLCLLAAGHHCCLPLPCRTAAEQACQHTTRPRLSFPTPPRTPPRSHRVARQRHHRPGRAEAGIQRSFLRQRPTTPPLAQLPHQIALYRCTIASKPAPRPIPAPSRHRRAPPRRRGLHCVDFVFLGLFP